MWWVRGLAGWPALIAEARRRAFDLAIQMHGDESITNAIVARLGARARAGFAPGPAEGLFLPYPRQGSEVRRLLRLVRFLGAHSIDERLEFPLVDDDRTAWGSHPGIRTLVPWHYVCVHPGARAADRRWPPAHFAAVADTLARETGLGIVLTGSAHEIDLTRAVAAAMSTPSVDAAAAVPVGALAALMAGSRLLVGNDTGTSHIAAALRLPSVIVFRNSEMDRWAPLDRERHRAVWDPDGTRVDEVLRQARALLCGPPPAG